jgi:hypothetical protein
VVREQGVNDVKRIALAVSDPASSKYGKYLTQEQLDSITKPTASDMSAVTDWLHQNDVNWTMTSVSNVKVTESAAQASKLFDTSFHEIYNSKHQQTVIRAASYSISSNIHTSVAAIFGLHGLPLPPIAAHLTGPPTPSFAGGGEGPGVPAEVDPNVLASTYKIGGVTATGSLKNRQAVAEFQGQMMGPHGTDLAALFKKYTKDYKVGVDDTVYRFDGDQGEGGPGVEARLDIQYIMAPAVGIKTEFWESKSTDFCNDLNKWTTNLTATADIPLVHSVSYGWQGDLAKIQCTEADSSVVDNNFAKLAAKGITVVISSGDSGSGYEPAPDQCNAPNGGGTQGYSIIGPVARSFQAATVDECCEEATSSIAAGWTFVQDSHESPQPTQRTPEVRGDCNGPPSPPFKFRFGTGASCASSSECPWAQTGPQHGTPPGLNFRDISYLAGAIDQTGGQVMAHSTNGSYSDMNITFGAACQNVPGFPIYDVPITANFCHPVGSSNCSTYHGDAQIEMEPHPFPTVCKQLAWDGGYTWLPGPNPPPPLPPGTCTLFKAVSLNAPANVSTISGVPVKADVVLWPSWPASSPWVTAVGATRFNGQVVGNEEIASDQFGSGGGFSNHFSQYPNASWQYQAVNTYLNSVGSGSLPPNGSFPVGGRATPDVSVLGEGYQVFNNGNVISVGGTSASAPTFASMVSLLNEARLNAGKPAMGFLNPFLYTNPTAFTDVVHGSNKIDRSGGTLAYGFDCWAGWDPATGLGTPKFEKLLAAAMATVSN